MIVFLVLILFIRPITAGLVDYEDDDDDEDYNPPPPPTKKHEDGLIDENAPLNISKHKRKPSSSSMCDANKHHDSADVVAKKPKLEARLTSSKIAILTKKDNQVPPDDKLVDMSMQTENESNGSDFSNSESTIENENNTENKDEIKHDTQLPDDCSTPLSNSEPYPVR